MEVKTCVLPTCLGGIADAQHAAVGQGQATGALDVEEEEVDRVGGPADLEPAPRERAVGDLGAVVIKDIVAVFETATALLTGQRIDLKQIGGLGVDGHFIAGPPNADRKSTRLNSSH